MKTYRYTPSWRHADRHVELVQQPTRAWFNGVTNDKDQLLVRFALAQDGELYFGDGYHVLHQDMMAFRGPGKEEPLLIGALKRIDGFWYVVIIQYWGQAKSPKKMASKLLNRLEDWVNATNELGNDPFGPPPAGWAEGLSDSWDERFYKDPADGPG